MGYGVWGIGVGSVKEPVEEVKWIIMYYAFEKFHLLQLLSNNDERPVLKTHWAEDKGIKYWDMFSRNSIIYLFF